MSATEFLNRVAELDSVKAFYFALGALACAIENNTTEHVFEDTLEGLAEQYREAA